MRAFSEPASASSTRHTICPRRCPSLSLCASLLLLSLNILSTTFFYNSRCHNFLLQLTVSIGIDTASTQEITEGSGASDMGLRQVREAEGGDADEGGWPAASRRR